MSSKNICDNNLIEFLINHADSNRVSFHMPGHKGSDIFRRFGYSDVLDKLADLDITEIHGADNLFMPEGPIKALMERYAELYGAKKTFLSVGGSSNGLMASIMAAVEQMREKTSEGIEGNALSENKFVIMARNSHKSIFHGVTLAGARPEYVYPEIIKEWGIAGKITAEEAERCICHINESYGEGAASVLVIGSPNYYGIISDVRAISEVCHRHGVILIVDQAHGAHLKFMDEESAAENLGADIVVNSIHKTLASFTQTGIVNLCSDRVDADILADKMQMIQTSSPSYILMASLGMNAEIIGQAILDEHASGETIFDEWKENLDFFYNKAREIDGLRVFEGANHDRTKLLLNMYELGLNGAALYEGLRTGGIDLELYDAAFAMAMTGVGNTKEDYDILIKELERVSVESKKSFKNQSLGHTSSISEYLDNLRLRGAEETGYISGPFEKVSLEDSVGHLAAETIVPYPPGIVLIAPGEVITNEALSLINQIEGAEGKILGIHDNEIRIIRR